MKDIREQVKRRFDVDTKDHAMRVLHEDGLYRHLRFRSPDSSSYWFDIITWPGNLTINGDMGCYVFARTEDMFEFFRADRRHGPRINPAYWQEKIRNEGSRKSSEKFDPAKFRSVIHQQVKDWLEDREPLTSEQYADLWRDINCEIFEHLNDWGDGQVAYDNACGFLWESDGRRFEFRDLFDYRYNDFTFHYIWNCYAIAHAIQAYDQANEKTAA
ncbi:MAG TPA: hypothetical protein VJ654_14305 [Noviherbaspirillum sp.]|nr:hypothetical protein [Noviherbaspirillum sp.]